MAIAERSAVTTRDGSLASGSGVVRVLDGELGEMPATWASRTEHARGKTSPEELAATAHSAKVSVAAVIEPAA